MKDSDWILYMYGLKGKEYDLKKKIQNQRSDADNEGKSGKDQDGGSLEKTTLDKQQPKDINEEAATPGASKDNVTENAGKDVSSEPKIVDESADEPANEDVGTSCQLNDCVESPSDAKRERLADEDVGTSPQQTDVAQAKRQKME